MNKEDKRNKAKWLIDYASEDYLDSTILMLESHIKRLLTK